MINCLRKNWLLIVSIICVHSVSAQSSIQQYRNVIFSQVQINDKFWLTKIEKISAVTIPVCIDQTEVKTPRIRNFELLQENVKENLKVFFMMTQMSTKHWKLLLIH